MRDVRVTILVRAVLAFGAAVFLCACSLPGSTGSAELDQAPVIEAGSTSTDPTKRGLELRVLRVDDSENRVANALARFAQDSEPFVAEDHDRWRRWGLRWIAVPIDDLDAVLANQDMIQAIQIRQMGEFPEWHALIRTGKIRNNTVRIQMQSGTSTSRPLSGRPRLLARAWTTPVVTESGVIPKLRVDLGVQISNPSQSTQWQTPTLRTVLDEGPLLDELLSSVVLDASHALILIGLDPSVDWNLNEDIDEVSVQIATNDPHGPNAPRLKTLGEQMFTTYGTGSVAIGMRFVPPKKVLIVLVPKVASDYRLLGPTTQAGTTP